jgi:hypothetical protein
MKKIISFLLILLAAETQGQQINLITPDEFPAATVTRNDTFSGDALYGYIDGGSDLVFEYGFKAVYVSEYKLGAIKAQLEIWQMNDPSSAFGLYSLSIAQCRDWNRFGTFSCSTPYQVASASGPLYINATNRMGSRDGQAFCEELVKKVLEKNPQQAWYIPPIFQHPKLAPYINSLRMFRGPLAVGTALPAWSDLLDNMGFRMYTVSVMTQTFSGILARIEFTDESGKNSFLSRSGVNTLDYSTKPVITGNGAYRSWFDINSTTILFMEATSDGQTIKQLLPDIQLNIPQDNR